MSGNLWNDLHQQWVDLVSQPPVLASMTVVVDFACIRVGVHQG